MSLGLIIIILFSITLHEYAHGYAAYKLGDPTPKISGRLTLNPLAHIDTFGTIFLPIAIFILTKGTFLFGYGKPIHINPYHFKNPKKDTFLVSISGPLTNILIALFLALMLHVRFLAPKILTWGIVFNLMLAIFNLIPVPPLDGSKIIACLLPNRVANTYLKIEPYGFLVIAFLLVARVFNWLIFPAIKTIMNLAKIEVIL